MISETLLYKNFLHFSMWLSKSETRNCITYLWPSKINTHINVPLLLHLYLWNTHVRLYLHTIKHFPTLKAFRKINMYHFSSKTSFDVNFCNTLASPHESLCNIMSLKICSDWNGGFEQISDQSFPVALPHDSYLRFYRSIHGRSRKHE